MSALITTIDTPQDIYILSAYHHDIADDEAIHVGFTDDYCTFDVGVGNKKVLHSESAGSVAIMTKEQVLAVAKRMGEWELYYEHGGLNENGYPELDSDKYAIIVRNFSGEIKVDLLDDKNKGYITTYEKSDKYPYGFYLFEHLPEKHPDGWLEPIIRFPEGTVVQHVHTYQVLDEVKGVADWTKLPDMTTKEEFVDAIQFIKDNYGKWDFEYHFTRQINPIFFNGYMLGKFAGTEHHAHVNDRVTDFTKDRKVFSEIWGCIPDDKLVEFLADFFFATDVYKKRLNEIYRPLRRPKDEVDD